MVMVFELEEEVKTIHRWMNELKVEIEQSCDDDERKKVLEREYMKLEKKYEEKVIELVVERKFKKLNISWRYINDDKVGVINDIIG